jgi:hypothetical protein
LLLELAFVHAVIRARLVISSRIEILKTVFFNICHIRIS